MSNSAVRIIAASGVLGSGFRESSMQRGLALKPHLIGCDAGSTDPGPYYLGSGDSAFPTASIKRDLSIMMKASLGAKIPLIVGSACTAGGHPHILKLKMILLEIARENNMSFKLAIIQAEQNKDKILEFFHAGKIKTLSLPGLDHNSISGATRIVAMMGAEPFMQALTNKADIIIAGRASDCAIFSALPLMRGISPGVAWHAAKILECGAASAAHRVTPDCLFAELKYDNFEVEPLGMDMVCTPQSVAAHSLYENSDPFKLTEPSGVIDISKAEYCAVNDRRVRVTGSRFLNAKKYTFKLEGAKLAGYQSVFFGGIRDPLIISQIDDWISKLRNKVADRVIDVFSKKAPYYHFNVALYGKNAVMGPIEPIKDSTPHELGLILEVTSHCQETSNTIISMARHQALHLSIPEWSGLITGVACRYSPPFLERGEVYEFIGNSIIETEDPLEFFPCKMFEIKEGK